MKQFYELKVTLVDTDPSVWRTFLIETDVTFNELHYVLQAVMGWTNSHYYVFRRDMMTISPSSRHDPIDSTSNDLDASKTAIAEFFKHKGDAIEYTYDFGDSWEHLIELKEIVEHEDIHLALCLEGERACPPEDCGGIPGYLELVNVMQDPDSEEYEEMVEWLGEPYDSDHFDINQVNADLERISVKYTKSHSMKIIPVIPASQAELIKIEHPIKTKPKINALVKVKKKAKKKAKKKKK